MALFLITGSRGFIGRHLARALSGAAHCVIGLGHGSWSVHDAKKYALDVWFEGDVDRDGLKSVQDSVGVPDVIYHLAGGSSVGLSIENPKEDFFRTVATTVDLLEWMRLHAPSSRLVVISSAAVYGAGHHGPISEDDPRTPFSPYGFHKQMMEDLCRSYAATYGVKVAIVRLFSVFGSELRKQLLWDLCSRLANNPDSITLGGTGDELRDWTDVRDVVAALELLASQASVEARAFNVGTGRGVPVREIAQRVVECWADSNGAISTLSFSGHARSGDPFSLVACPDRLNELGFSCSYPLDLSLQHYVQWAKLNVPGANQPGSAVEQKVEMVRK